MRPRMSQGSDADGVGSRIQGSRSARLGPEERAPWAAGSRKVSAAGAEGWRRGRGSAEQDIRALVTHGDPTAPTAMPGRKDGWKGLGKDKLSGESRR